MFTDSRLSRRADDTTVRGGPINSVDASIRSVCSLLCARSDGSTLLCRRVIVLANNSDRTEEHRLLASASQLVSSAACFFSENKTVRISQSIDRSVNMFICIAPNKQKSSEVLAAKQMGFELLCECVNGKRRGPQFDRESVPSRWLGLREVTPADGGPCIPGTTCVPLFADRSCHLPTTDETGVPTSAR